MLEQTQTSSTRPPTSQYQELMSKALHKCAENLRLDLSLDVHLPVLCMS